MYDDEITSGREFDWFERHDAPAPREVPTGADADKLVARVVDELLASGMTADELAGADWQGILEDCGAEAYELDAALEARIVAAVKADALPEFSNFQE